MAIKIPTLPEQLPTTQPRFVGKEIKRVEDPGLVAGTAAFIDNLSLPGMLHCAILRSPHPHARVVKVDVRAAEALPGVFAVLTGEDVRRWANPAYTAPKGWGGYCIAGDKVRLRGGAGGGVGGGRGLGGVGKGVGAALPGTARAGDKALAPASRLFLL